MRDRIVAADKTGNTADNADDLREIRVRRDSPAPGSRDAFLDLKNQLAAQILTHLEPRVDAGQRAQIRPYVHDRLDGLLEERGIVLNRGEKRQLLEAIVAELTNSRP
jgi:hypothetical protein